MIEGKGSTDLHGRISTQRTRRTRREIKGKIEEGKNALFVASVDMKQRLCAFLIFNFSLHPSSVYSVISVFFSFLTVSRLVIFVVKKLKKSLPGINCAGQAFAKSILDFFNCYIFHSLPVPLRNNIVAVEMSSTRICKRRPAAVPVILTITTMLAPAILPILTR